MHTRLLSILLAAMFGLSCLPALGQGFVVTRSDGTEVLFPVNDFVSLRTYLAGFEILRVSSSRLSFSATASEQSVTVTTNVYDYAVSCPEPWVSTSTSVDASGRKVLTIGVAANSSGSTRTATVTLTAGTVSTTVAVTQGWLYVTPSVESVSFDAMASERIVSVSTNAPTLDAVSTAPWLTATVAGNLKSVTLSAAANTSIAERTATVILTGGAVTATISVTQAGILSLSVTPTEVNFGNAAATQSVAVESNVDWSVSSSASWLTATKASATSLTLSATANTSTAERTATVTLTGDGLTATLSVMQAGVEPDPLGLCPDANHPHAIDMGTGVMFACCNVGASTPADYGDHFAWGETSPKSTYNWSTYKWCNGSSTTMTKYCTSSSYGTVDNLTQLELSDDAARAVMGGTWRMPTFAELSALSSNCTWTWTSKGGHNGYLVTASNGNKLFLPAAGYRNETSLYRGGSGGGYWSSTLDASGSGGGQGLYFNGGGRDTDDFYRCDGRSVRAVTE